MKTEAETKAIETCNGNDPILRLDDGDCDEVRDIDRENECDRDNVCVTVGEIVGVCDPESD